MLPSDNPTARIRLRPSRASARSVLARPASSASPRRSSAIGLCPSPAQVRRTPDRDEHPASPRAQQLHLGAQLRRRTGGVGSRRAARAPRPAATQAPEDSGFSAITASSPRPRGVRLVGMNAAVDVEVAWRSPPAHRSRGRARCADRHAGGNAARAPAQRDAPHRSSSRRRRAQVAVTEGQLGPNDPPRRAARALDAENAGGHRPRHVPWPAWRPASAIRTRSRRSGAAGASAAARSGTS